MAGMTYCTETLRVCYPSLPCIWTQDGMPGQHYHVHSVYIWQNSLGGVHAGKVTGFGLSDGEVCERLWSFLRRFATMTKEMRPAHRVDVLTDALISGVLRTGTRQEVIIYLHCILHCLYTRCESLMKMKTWGHVAPPTFNRIRSSKTTPTYILLQNGCPKILNAVYAFIAVIQTLIF